MKRALIVIVILFCIFTVTGSGLLLTANLPSMAYEGGSGSSASLKDEIEAHASGNWDSYRSSFSGSGTSSSPYIINTAGKLAQFSYMTRNNSSYRSKYYKITADINMSAHYFTPACGDGNPFTGRLDGGNYIISNLTISGGWLHTGLINMIEGTVQNVVLRNVSIDSDAVVGSIAGIVRDTGTISNCVVSSGNLYGAWVGGIVGTLAERGKVQGCLNKARINVDSGYSIPSQMGGGIVGKLQGEQEGSISVEAIKNCQNAGQVSSTSRAGGIVGHVTAGYNYAGSITNCFNRGSVNGTSYIGGIIGYSEGENKMSMFDCINVGTLSGTNYRGNIIGYCSSGFMLIWTCYYPSGGASAFGYKSSAVSTSSVSSITPGQYNLNTGAGVHTFMKNYSWSGDYKWNGWSSGVSYGNTVNNGYPLYSSSYTTVMIRNYNGPTNSTIVSKMIMYGELINIGTNSNSPTGYTLNGYYSGSNGAGTLYISRDGSSSYYGSASIPVYLYAYWNARVYTISLNPQNGSGGTGTIYLKYNTGWYSSSSATSSISSISRPSRTGYTFQGYYTATSGGTQIINSSGRILSGKLTYTTANDTLFAQWEANQYDVNVYVPDRTATPDITQPATIWNLTNGKQVQRTYGQSMTVSVALGAGYHFSHWEISGLSGTTTSTSQTFTFTMPANDVTLTAYAEKNDYTIDINVLSPGGVQDYNSGTFTAYFSENGQTYNNCTDQPYTEVRYNETIVISNIAPATGMSLASVTCGNGRITQSGGTYTYTATMTGTPSDSWDDTITIQMRWNYYTVDINIMSPAVVQDEASGSMDLRYADGTTAQDTTNEVVDSSTGTSKAIQYNTTITISDIRPFGVYHLKSVTCSNGRLVDNGDGSYTYTASMTFSPGSQGTWDDVIIIQMTYLQQDSDGNYYIEDGKYPQSYAEVEWDTYLGDGTYNGVSMTYDEKTKIITLNGTTSSGTTIFYVHGITFTSGQQYTTGYEYVSGGFSKTGNGTPVLYVDTVNSSNGTMNTRNYVDSVIGTSDRTATLTISNLSQSNADGFRIAMTTNGATATFNNYKIRFMVRYDSILNNVAKTNSGSLSYLDSNGQTQTIQCYTVSTAVADMPAGSEFALVGGRWFKVEPIRWLVTDVSTKLTITGSGGWETIGQTINVKANTQYTLKMNYKVPNYTPLSGYNGLAFMVLTSSPQDTDCKSIALTYTELPNTESSGEVSLTFNSGSYTTVYVVLNFGYVNDGSTYTFEFGDLRISDNSVNVVPSVLNWTRYLHGDRFNITENSLIASNGVVTNKTLVSDKVLLASAVTNQAVSEGWGFINSGNIVTSSGDYTVHGSRLDVSYDASSNVFTLTLTGTNDPLATINQTIYLNAGVTYRMSMTVTNASGASVSDNKVQVFYAINGAYNETQSVRFGGKYTSRTFSVSTSGTYKIRFDNDYGNTLKLSGFSVTVETSNEESSELAQNVESQRNYVGLSHSVSAQVDNYIFGPAGQQNKVLTMTRIENGMRVASVDEVEQNTSDMRAYASDLVYFLLGINSNQYANYWTRTLGTNLGNGKIITAAGMDTSSWLSRVFGVRFAMTGTWS